MHGSIGTGLTGRPARLREPVSRGRAPLLACLCLLATGCSVSPQTHVREREVSAAVAPVLLYRQPSRADEFRRLVVPVELNGQGPFFFLLDTGAVRSEEHTS